MNQSLIRCIAAFLIWFGLGNLIHCATQESFISTPIPVVALVNSLGQEFLILDFVKLDHYQSTVIEELA